MVNFKHTIGGLNSKGLPMEVEIDESQFYKRKSNKGRIGKTIWVFEGIGRDSRKCFLVPVENRSRETLKGVIFEKIDPGTRILSDSYASYRSLYNSSIYEHDEVNYSLNFVNPNDITVHTQNVESIWCHVRKPTLYQ
jgi:hypothetical protein